MKRLAIACTVGLAGGIGIGLAIGTNATQAGRLLILVTALVVMAGAAVVAVAWLNWK